MLAQTRPIIQSTANNAQTLFYLTLLVIFITAIVTTLATKWARDKCLKFFQGYRVTLERARGQTLWGRLKVFSSGLEVIYDHASVTPGGRRKRSFMFYQQEVEQILSILRYHDELAPERQQERLRQVYATFNPGLFRRTWRGIRNVVNTLRDAFNAAIGTAVQQFQHGNPVLATQGGAVSNLGQTLLGRFANAYEPMLEQYIGQPVILDVADPINPNNAEQEYSGYLADYTQQFIAVFNVEHTQGEEFTIALPDVEGGDALPPLPPPPPPGAAAPVLWPPLATAQGLAVRIDGIRLKIQNTRQETVAVRRMERDGFEPLDLQMLLPPNATLNLPARDARGARLTCQVVHCMDVIAPRRFATVRHAGERVPRPGLKDELQLDRLPLVSRLFAQDTNGEDSPPASSSK